MKNAKYANDWAVGQASKKKAPKYVLPMSFTDQFLQNSAARQNNFTKGLKAWVDTHKQDKTRSKEAKEKDVKIASNLAKVLEKAYVSLPDFLKVFRRHLQELSKAMTGSYYMTVHSIDKKIPKSSAWLAPLVNEALQNRHALQGYLESDIMNDSITITNISNNRTSNSTDNKWPVGAGRNIVYADDGIYSGRQLREFVATLIGFLWRAARKKAIRGREKTHMWIVIPYRTSKSQALLSDLHQGRFIDNLEDLELYISGFGANRTPIKEVLEFAEKELVIHVVNLDKYEKIPDTREVFEKTGVKRVMKSAGGGSGLLVFEHKVPDSLSFPRALAQGQQVRHGIMGLPGVGQVPFVPQYNAGKPYTYKPYRGNTNDMASAPGMTRQLHGDGHDIMIRALEKKKKSKDQN